MMQLFAEKPLLIGGIGFLLGVFVTLLVAWVAFYRMYGRE